MPADIQIQVSGGLAAAQATAVLDLVRRATSADGVSPLSEHARLHLRYGGDPRARDLLLWRDGQLAGYAHLDPPDPESGWSGEMTIDPGFRRQGLGLALARALIGEAASAACGCGPTATCPPRTSWRRRPASSGPGPCSSCAAR